MAFKTSEKYKSVIYSGDCRHKLKLLFNGVELEDADVFCESLKVTSRILPNGSTRFSLDNFIAKEAEIILHDIDTTIIQSPVNISIGTLVDGTYEYVPIGLFVVQDLPTTDKNKTTIKLRDYAVKFDFGYNAKDIIDENGGSVTKLQILQDICNKAGVETDITKFYGSNSKIGIYDNTITGRTYISYLAEQAGAIATIDRSGKLIFVQLKDLETVEIPLEIVEKYEDGEEYEISRVVYEDAIRKFEYGDESKDTLFINTANPYIDDEVLTNTLTGTKIETSDSSNNEVVNYKQYGYTKQDGTPTPDTPVEIEVGRGKNLFNKDLYTYDYVTQNNTGNMEGYKDIPIYVGKSNTPYFVSTNFLNGYTPYGKNYLYVLIANYAYGNDKWVAIGHTLGTPDNINYYNKSITSDSNGYLYLRVNINVTKELYEELMENVEVQIEEGDKKTKFLPYNTIETKTKTKNILKNSSFRENLNSWVHDAIVEITEKLGKKCLHIKNVLNETNVVYQEIQDKIEIGKTYTISCYAYVENYVAGTTNPFLALYFGGRKINGDWGATQPLRGTYSFLNFDYSNGFVKVVCTFKIPEDIDLSKSFKCFVYSRDNTADLYVYDLQIEPGDVDTDYQEFQESSITYNLGDNFLADKDYIQDSVLNKNIVKVVFDGSEVWNKWSTNVFYIPKLTEKRESLSTLSTHFKFVTTPGASALNNGEFCITTSANNYCVLFKNTDYDNVTDFKAWLSKNPVTVYYEMTEPEQIQLETTGELRTFEPNTIITNDLDSEMEVEYKMNQTQVSQILELNKNIPLNSFKTGKIFGNPAIDAYDIIKIIDGDKEFKTLATNDLTYNGVMINTFDTQIGKEAKKENVTLTGEASLKKWAKTEIDNINAEVKITTGKIEEHVVELQKDVDNNSVNINNNYQEVIKKFGDYTPISKTVQIENSVTQLQTDTYTKTEINTKLTDGSVTKVMTTSGTFDENGMHYEKTGAPTKSTINERGVNVDSSTTGDELLFAGYDEELKQTIVRTENLTVRRYLVIGKNSRIEDYTDEDGNEGGGIFTL